MSGKPKLLILELWGLGDVAIASRFIQAASQQFEVTLVAKPYASDLQSILWPEVKVVPFVAPWTAFRGKYRLHQWPWASVSQTLKQLRHSQFEIAVSGRWDPRDHAWMFATGARRRIGFPRTGSSLLLTKALQHPGEQAHRFDQWVSLGSALGIRLDHPFQQKRMASDKPIQRVLIHTGAAQPVRVWPLEQYARLRHWLLERKVAVQVVCDPQQESFWKREGIEPDIPRSVLELATQLKQSDAFIGNDSGPGHLAAALDIPTLSIFGPQRTEWFRPVHPLGRVVEGKDCPHKPCFDHCRFNRPHCMLDVPFEEVIRQCEAWLASCSGDSQTL